MNNKKAIPVKYNDLVEIGQLCLVMNKKIEELTIKVNNLETTRSNQ